MSRAYIIVLAHKWLEKIAFYIGKHIIIPSEFYCEKLRVTQMPVKVSTRFHPLRMVMKRREPVHFDVSVQNANPEPIKLTIRVMISSELSFSKGGFKAHESAKIENLAPGQVKTLMYELHPKPTVKAGEHLIEVIVDEHKQSFNQISNQIKHEDFLQVE